LLVILYAKAEKPCVHEVPLKHVRINSMLPGVFVKS
jgi:hypothetical protein